MHNFHLFSSGCAHKCIVRKLPSCYSSLQLQISLMVDVKCSVVDRRAQEYVLLFNGVIYCEQDVIKNWMVVDQENGTIAAIGSDSELSTAEKLWRPERKIDLHGQFVLPVSHYCLWSSQRYKNVEFLVDYIYFDGLRVFMMHTFTFTISGVFLPPLT